MRSTYSKDLCLICVSNFGVREWVKSKLLYQDTDVMSFADKCNVVGCFADWDCNKFLMEKEKFSDKPRAQKKDSFLVFTESLSRRILRSRTSAIDLIQLERVSTSASSFLVHRLAYSSQTKYLVSWIWDRFPVFWTLAQRSFSLMLPVSGIEHSSDILG